MTTWLSLARGPIFWAALAFMVLGLGRRACLTAWEGIRVYRRAGDRKIPTAQVAKATVRWLIPVGQLKNRWPTSIATLVLHVSFIVVPLFLAGHIALWKRGIGLSWPALNGGVADALTLAGLVAALAVVLLRAVSHASRALGRVQDYVLPLLLAVPFASGWLMAHPADNPWPFEATFLVHVLSGDLVLFLVPLTKLSHMILLPFTQLISELSWHFPPDAGRKVGIALNKEHDPI